MFYQGSATYERLSQLRGKRISLGVPGSGLSIVANDLLTENCITTNNSTLVELNGANAYEQRLNNKGDTAFFIGRADSDLIHTRFKSGIKLMSFSQADALVQKFPSLSKITYPRDTTSLINDKLAHDVTLLAATAMQVSKEKQRPVLAYLLLDAANVIHDAPLFQIINHRIFDDLAQAHVQAFNGVDCINDSTHLRQVGKEGNDLLPHGSYSREFFASGAFRRIHPALRPPARHWRPTWFSRPPPIPDDPSRMPVSDCVRTQLPVAKRQNVTF